MPVGLRPVTPVFLRWGSSVMQGTTEHLLAKRCAGMTPSRKMDEAIRAVEGGMSQASAARGAGVSRSRLNQKLKAYREALERQEERSAQARAERTGKEPPTLRVENETRRVPPIGEFVRTYFDGTICPDCDVHHEVPGFHDEIMSTMVDPAVKRLLVNVPPYHSKSTNGTVYTTVYELCKDPNSRTAIISKSNMMAKRFVRQIAELLTNPDLYETSTRNLIEDWGPFTSGTQPWNTEGFYVAGRNTPERDPSVSAYGIGTQIYGARFDRIICDDVADLKNQANPDLVAEQLKQITQEFQSRVGKSGKLMIIGTRVSAGDIYSYLKDLPGYTIIRHPCILDEYSGTTLWGEHFTFEDAKLQRDSMSSEQFELVYQNSDMPGFGASFQPEHLEKCHDVDRRIGNVPQGASLVMGLDLAGAGAAAGFTAGVVLGIDISTGQYYLVDLFNVKQMKAPQMKDQILDWADQYPLRELWAEGNGLQSQLVQYNTELIGPLAGKNIRVQSPVTTHQSKYDPVFGVESMAVLYHNGVVSTPHGDVYSRRRFKELEDQLLQFPMGRQDLVMALWLAYRGCRELYQRATLPAFDPRTSKWPGRIKRRRRVFDPQTGVRRPTAEELEGGDLFAERRLQRIDQLVNVKDTHDGKPAWVNSLTVY